MATLGSYYSLCPLIDTQSLLGISEDQEKGVVIVTLGKNVANRYKLSDQKQLSCWRTKEKFTSPVMFDERYERYVAVFNHSYIKMWNLDENTQTVKKYKFTSRIRTLISNSKVILVVFMNGFINELTKAIEQRAICVPENIIQKNIRNITSRVFNEKTYIGLTDEDEDCFYWTILNEECMKFSKLELQRDGCSIRGFCFHEEKNRIAALILWSDGNLLSYPLEPTDINQKGDRCSIIDCISTDYDISMESLDPNYIVFYGADSNNEGAALIIYNMQFNVVQARQHFKLFTSGSRLWLMDNNLLLPVGQNLAVVPFKLSIQQLVALIGSHKSVSRDTDTDIRIINELDVASWTEPQKIKDREVPDLLKNMISDLVYQGMPENMILEEILPNILLNKNTKALFRSIRYFSDLPENYLAKILQFVLEVDAFKENGLNAASVPKQLQSSERINLLDNILEKAFNKRILLNFLRSELSLSNVAVLIEYINAMLFEYGYVLPGLSLMETENKLIEWSTILIDSSYQRMILSNSDTTKKILKDFEALIQRYIMCLSDIKEILPLLQEIKSSKSITKESRFSTSMYNVEQTTLY